MSRKPVDFVTLDALVQGEDDPETPAAWRALLTTPDAATRWAQAVARRATIDRFAMEVLNHPWLASSLSRLRRKTRFPVGVALSLHLVPPPLTALLGPTSRAPELLTAPAWGEIESLSVKVGLTLELHPFQAPGEHVRVFYQSRTAQGSMPGRRWKLEPGESPVLLMAVEGADADDTLDSALSKSLSSAGVVLFELAEEAPED
ncbi:hypothetical protein [Corallococcus sicarius]|uniref:Uncharacterized protein n=1 Tax=Corallococcus sicarius TaxID=2316726 RepID=A0A3A8P0S8_9BACT|nr:hypothetical protein [Corallococcus sicarius]RKH48141.1 hypothetical protein D7X12_00740 [Corallococcus sicarius]